MAVEPCREAFRVRKPGGRLAVSGMVELRPLPQAAKQDLELRAGCIAGTITVEDSGRYSSRLRPLERAGETCVTDLAAQHDGRQCTSPAPEPRLAGRSAGRVTASGSGVGHSPSPYRRFVHSACFVDLSGGQRAFDCERTRTRSTGNRTSEDITYSSTAYVSKPQSTHQAAGAAEPHMCHQPVVVSSPSIYWTRLT